MTPDDRKYAKTHEWAKVEGTTATVGITNYAQEQLGDITFVELPEVGKRLQRGQECGVIESVKAASDIYAPVSGEVAEVNGQLDDSPETVNKDPFGAGWVLKLKDIETGELSNLMDAKTYEYGLEK